jgi:hypothetical protein
MMRCSTWKKEKKEVAFHWEEKIVWQIAEQILLFNM